MEKQKHAVGRRKEAVTRVFISKGEGKITVNDKDYKAYFPLVYLQNQVESPLKTAEVEGKFDPKLLAIHYVEFEILEGWKAGKFISQIHYDGVEIFAEFTDDGQAFEHVGCVYQVDKKGAYKETDIFLMFDGDEGEWKFDADVISNFINK